MIGTSKSNLWTTEVPNPSRMLPWRFLKRNIILGLTFSHVLLLYSSLYSLGLFNLNRERE